MKKIQIRYIFFVLIMTLLLFSACSRTDEQPKSTDNTAADFTLERIDGEKIVLSEILKSKNAVLVFWATWCSHCKKEILHIERFYKENKDKTEVIGINVKESRAKVEKFLNKKDITYPVVLDSDGKVANLYNVRGIPTIVAVSREGKIIYYGHSIEEMLGKIDF